MTDQDEAFEKLIRSLEDPDEVWSDSTHTLDNRKLGIEVYTNTHRSGYGLWKPVPLKFSKGKSLELANACDVAASNALGRVFKKAEDAPEPGSIAYTVCEPEHQGWWQRLLGGKS